MVRILKAYDERKEEIISVSSEFFYEKGYYQTSVSAIIDKIGISKGTFYYYFKSKEELLDSLVEKKTQEAFEIIEKVTSDPNLGALERLNKVYEVSRSWQSTNLELIRTILRVMYREENILLKQKMQERSVAVLTPLFESIITQGIEEGVFQTKYPKEVGELILRIGNNLGESTSLLFLELDQNPENLDEIEKRIIVYEDAVERILGAPKGSIQILDKEFLRQFTEDYFENLKKLDSVKKDSVNVGNIEMKT